MNTTTLKETRENKIVAVTGATGFIGRTLLQQLTNAGWQVRALHRTTKLRTLPTISNVQWVAGELNDESALNTLISGAYAVIHCAGAVRGASQADFDRVNEEGALRVTQAALRQAEIPRLLLISSLAARMPNLSYYAGSKWRGEAAIKAATGNLRWTILRPPAVYGHGDRELLPLFRSMAKGFAPLPAPANGRFSMIHVEDLTNAMLCWLDADAGYGQTFELDDGRAGGYDWDAVLSISSNVLRGGAKVRRVLIPISLLKLVAFVNLASSKLFGYAPMLTPGKVREITHPDWVSDSFALRQTIDWQPTIQLEQGLARIFD